MTIARKSVKVPELKKAIELGQITVSNAKLLTSVITPENKKEWLDLGATLTKPKLEKAIVKVSPKALVIERVQYVQEDVLKLTVAISEESLSILKRVQDLESQRTGRAVSLDEAIKAMGQEYLKKHDPVEKARRAEKAKITKTIKTAEDRKIKNLEKTEAESAAKENSPSGRVEQTDSFIGRTPLKAELKHKVNLRDEAQCCYFHDTGQRCENKRWLDTHHKIPVSKGSTNTLENLVTLCKAHHQAMH
jgi:hypothetical protein